MKWRPGEPALATAPRHFDDKLDIAVLILPNAGALAVPELPFDRLGDSAKLERRSIVRAMGYPDNKGWYASPTDDRVSSISSELARFASTSVKRGYSGGALLNDKWEIVGITRLDEPPEAEAVRIERVIERFKEWGYPVQLGPASSGPGALQPTVTNEPVPRTRVASLAGRWRDESVSAMECASRKPGRILRSTDGEAFKGSPSHHPGAAPLAGRPSPLPTSCSTKAAFR